MTFFELVEALKKEGNIKIKLPNGTKIELKKMLDSYEQTLIRKLNEIQEINSKNEGKPNFVPKNIKQDNEAKVKKRHLEFIFQNLQEWERINFESA